jgi:indole-3-glycerol phosphate synthase
MLTLGDRNIQIIAEVKTHSPFGWTSLKGWDELFKIADKVGEIISIHTDPRWHGSFDLLKKAKSLTDKPILAKGIHESDASIKRAIEAGADYVLVVGRMPKLSEDVLLKCMVEPCTLDELRSIPSNMKAVWNSRDLVTGGLKSETFDQVREIFPGWLCQASNIKTIADVNENTDAVLVGTHLEEFARSIILPSPLFF